MKPALIRRGLLPLERLFRASTRSQRLPGIDSFLLSVHPYAGESLTLPDGTEVRRGATVGEIHFWNEHIADGYETVSERSLLWRFKRDFEADLRRLAEQEAAGALPADLVALFGVTPLAPMAGRMGFTHIPLRPGLRLRLLTLWQRWLGRAFRPVGHQRPAPARSGACWLSRSELRRRYGHG